MKTTPLRKLEHGHAVALGFGLIVAGSYVLYEAYELRGRPRPWWLKWAPGP